VRHDRQAVAGGAPGQADHRELAGQALRSFGVNSRTLRIGSDRAKGYEATDFAEAFARYLPDPGLSKRDTVTTPVNIGPQPTFQSVTTEKPVTAADPQETVANIGLSRCHGSNPPESEPVEAMLL